MADDENPDIPVVEEGSGKNPLLTLVLVLNTLITGAATYLMYSAHQKQSSQPTVQDIVSAVKAQMTEEEKALEVKGMAKETDGMLFPLDPFTANLAQGDGPRRYVRLSAVLKFSKDSSEGEAKSRKPQIRDTIISILNSKRPEDVLRREGKVYLKEELKSAINAYLIDGKILDIYYISFQVN